MQPIHRYDHEHGDPTVACVGFVTKDITLSVPTLPEPEGTTEVKRRTALGGSATNTALGLSSFGIDTTLCSAVGRDPVGEWIESELDRHGLSRQLVTDPTGSKLITTISDTDARYLVENEGIGDVDGIAASLDHLNPDHVHATTSRPSLTDEVVRYLYDCEPDCRPTVSVEITQTYESGLFGELFEHADMLRCNEDEYEQCRADIGDLTASIDDVIVTRGSDATTWYLADGNQIEADQPTVSEDAVVDTTGAGDAFTAGLFRALFDGSRRRQALRAGRRTGASAVVQLGPVHDFNVESDDVA